MTYHLARDGAQLGTFAEDKLQEALASGELRSSDLAWHAGMTDWRPLGEIVSAAAGEAPGPLPPPIPALPPQPAALPAIDTSGLAIASLACGIASVCGGFITGLPAIFFGIVALKRISKSGGVLGGKGLAITGICLGGSLMILGTALLAGLVVPAYNEAQENIKMSEAIHNPRQIIIAMKAYARDHGGAYPDADPSHPKTANEVFRLLIKGGYVTDERIFTAPGHPEQADGNLGEAPHFKQALERGENHWAIITGLNEASPKDLPLIFERPNDNAWPPTWNASTTGRHAQNSAWKGSKIIVGTTDGMVHITILNPPQGTRATTFSRDNRFDIFDPARPMGYLLPE